ncbi:MAG: OmpA family protein [bacterium]
MSFLKKTQSTVLIFFFILFLGSMFFTKTLISSPFQDYENILFKDVETAKNIADSLEAEVYSPGQYEKAQNYYDKAYKAFRKGKEAEKFKDEIKMAEVYFLKAVETSKLFRTHLSDCVETRNRFLKVADYLDDKGDIEDVENEVKDVAEILEDGKLNKALQESKKVIQEYRELELIALKNKILSKVWKLLEKAKEKKVEKFAPKALSRAQQLADKAENILRKNHHDTTLAARTAMEAEYEASHSIHLAQKIQEIEEKNKTLEAILLQTETYLKNIASHVNMEPFFDKEYGLIVSQINTSIQQLKTERNSFQQKFQDANEQIALLQEQISEMESHVGDLESRKKELSQLVEEQKIRREQFAKVEALFKQDEAKILRDGQNVIIRLFAISFPSGKSIIQSNYFSLLSKVIKAIQLYPDCAITIEGHTDSRGSDKLNQKLSTDRSNAVKDYLIANSSIDASRLKSVGYGEKKPIASNNTTAGRQKNRRIDVVIIPSEDK